MCGQGHVKGVAVLRAVLVDDEVDLRMLTRFTLEDEGNTEVIGEAGDALEALDLIEQLTPDVAIIDIHLPGMNGVQLIAFLRSKSDVPRLVAYSSDDLALGDALRAGADAAVLKTGQSEALLLAVCA
jgi:two-component system, NarL family, nitrate/nitrite response regulator NarL